MFDLALYALVRTGLLVGLTAQGVATEVLQGSNAATVPAVDGVYLHLLFTTKVGQVKREAIWNPETEDFDRQETQWLNTTMQVGAVKHRAPGDVGLTANDMTLLAQGIIQGDTMLEAMRLQGVSILRPGDVRNLTVKNDRDQYETFPSFDFVLAHEQVILNKTPAALVKGLRIVPV